jgi:hypothetical protein
VKQKVVGIFFAIYLLYLGYDIYTTGTFAPDGYYDVDLGVYKYIVSLLCVFFSFYIMYKTLIINEVLENGIDIKYSKCPKCKTSYRYETLKDGMCPICYIKTKIPIQFRGQDT